MNLTDKSVQPGGGGVNALAAQLRAVALRRDIYAIAKGIMDNRRRAFEMANADANLEVESARRQLASAEKEARELALAAYAETGSKSPHAGVGIRVTTRIVYDRHLAFDWAQKHNIALSLDVKAFEAIAQSGTVGTGIVTYQFEPTATIATDLTKALGIEPEPEEPTQRDIDEEKGDQAFHAARDNADIEAVGGF